MSRPPRSVADAAPVLTAAMWGSSAVAARGLLDTLPPDALAGLRWTVVFTHLVPIFAAIFAAVFIGERLHPFHGAGFLLVAGGALLCCLRSTPVLSSSAATRAPAAK